MKHIYHVHITSTSHKGLVLDAHYAIAATTPHTAVYRAMTTFETSRLKPDGHEEGYRPVLVMLTPAAIIAAVADAGAIWNGIQWFPDVVLARFTDPVTKSTMSLPIHEVTADIVRAALERKRKEYGS